MAHNIKYARVDELTSVRDLSKLEEGNECVVLSDSVAHPWPRGLVVTVRDTDSQGATCVDFTGRSRYFFLYELALLPVDAHIAEPRKVIQLTTREKYLYALCDDGTMWYMNEECTTGWCKERDIPQD